MRTAAFLALIATSHAAEIESTFFAGNLKDPIELAAAPDGDVYVIEREGRLLRLRPSTGGLFEIGLKSVVRRDLFARREIAERDEKAPSIDAHVLRGRCA